MMRILLYVGLFLSTMHLQASNESVMLWNAHATRASQESREALPFAARALAILHTAIYDTLQVIAGERKVLYVKKELLQELEDETDPDAAITAAAHSVLTQLYPRFAHEFDEELLRAYAKLPSTAAKRQGILLGREVASQVLAWRARDFENAALNMKNLDKAVGYWNPESGTTPLVPYWATQPFFAIESASDFTVPPPPKCGESCYVEEYYHIKRLGHHSSHERLSDHTAIARFWDDSTTPIAHWNGVARAAIADKQLNQKQSAHLLALLNIALADSVMSSWEHKYHYRTWRPKEAIVRAKEVSDQKLLADKDWRPLINTPAYPDYPSAHSACAGAACVILQAYVGDKCAFSCNAAGTTSASKQAQPLTRRYVDFSSAAKEAALARVYAGVCFPASTRAGTRLGEQIAYYVLENKALLTSSRRISVRREVPDGAAGDEGIAPAIAEEADASYRSLAADRKLRDEVNKAENNTPKIKQPS